MVKRSKLATRAGIIAAIAVMTTSMSAVTAYAADLTPGNANTQYTGPGTVTTMTINGNKETLQTPTASDRCSLKYYGVDKFKQKEEDVKIYAYKANNNYKNATALYTATLDFRDSTVTGVAGLMANSNSNFGAFAIDNISGVAR